MKHNVTEDCTLQRKDRKTLENFLKIFECEIPSAPTDRSQIIPYISGEFRCQRFTDVCVSDACDRFGI